MGQRGGSIKTALGTLKVSRWPKRCDEIRQRGFFFFYAGRRLCLCTDEQREKLFISKTRIVHKFSMEMLNGRHVAPDFNFDLKRARQKYVLEPSTQPFFQKNVEANKNIWTSLKVYEFGALLCLSIIGSFCNHFWRCLLAKWWNAGFWH